MSDINQVLWGRSIDLLTSTTVFNDGDGVSIDNRVINVVFELLQQLQQSRREGREQAKSEAFEICVNGYKSGIGDKFQGDVFAYAINMLEYKEPTNDQ